MAFAVLAPTLGLVLAFVATAAAGAPPAPGEHAAPSPPPSAAEMIRRYYPKNAERHGMSGHVELDCLVTAYGGVFDCVVAAENPAGWGFGEAALKMAPMFRMKPPAAGQAIDGVHIHIPVAFALQP